MDIVQYLIELLKSRKQVGIEGLGTLYKKKIPGRYDAETHSFLPPSYTLAFTAEVLENSSLVQLIQRKRNISEDAAKYFISQFVAEVEKGLTAGTYELENLGALHKYEDGAISFQQSQDIDTGFEFFALPTVLADIRQTAENKEDITKSEPAVEDNLPLEAASNTKITEPEIEQVQVPEFEREMSLIADDGETDQAPKDPETVSEDETANQMVQPTADPVEENDDAEESHVELKEEFKEEVPSVERENTDSEATDEEVFEEINEVDHQVYSNATIKKSESEENWDFNGDDVVVDEDTQEEKFEENTPFDHPVDVSRSNANEAIKLTSTTKQWDFDTAGTYRDEDEPRKKDNFEDTLSEEHNGEEKEKMPLYSKVGIAILILIVVAAVVYFVKPEVFAIFSKNDTDPDQKMAIPVVSNQLKTQEDSLSFADSIMENAAKAGLNVEPAKDTISVTTKKTEVAPKITYDIIITSFATESKAQQYIAKLKKKGFDAKISTMHGKRKNISIASYNNVDSAEKDVIKFRKQFKNPEIYIQRIKNN